MANYPTSLPTLSNPAASDARVGHADQHANANDEIEAIAAAVGVTGSAVAGTVHYRLDALEDGGTETATTIGALIAGATNKASLDDADLIGVSDSAAGGVAKNITWAQLKAAIDAYLDDGGGAGADELIIAFFGDPQIGAGVGREQADVLRYRQQAQYVKAAGVDAAINMGDLINNGSAAQAAWQHDAFVFALSELSPMTNYPAIGNHDIWNNTTGLESTLGSAALTTWLSGGGRGEQVGMPAGGLANLGCYTVDITNGAITVRVIIWNSDPTAAEYAYPSKYTGTEHDTNMAWLDAALTTAASWRDAAAGRHVIATWHHSLFQVSIGEANTNLTIPNGLTGFTYNNPRTTIDGWIRAAGVKWMMHGHSAENRLLVVAESSLGADDGYTITETTGTSILSGVNVNALRRLTFGASSVSHTHTPLSATPAFAGRGWTAFDTLIAATALHYFRFDETAGVAVIDEMGTDAGAMRWAYSGTVTKGASPLGTASGTAISVSNGYFFSDGPFTPIAGSQTYVFLAQWAANGTVLGALQCGALGGAGANNGFTARTTTAGAMEWNVADGSGNRITVTSAVLTLNAPHLIGCEYDATENKARLYVDGTLAGEATCAGFTAATNNLLQFGTVGAQRFVGTLDQFSMHPSALGASAHTSLAAAVL